MFFNRTLTRTFLIFLALIFIFHDTVIAVAHPKIIKTQKSLPQKVKLWFLQNPKKTVAFLGITTITVVSGGYWYFNDSLPSSHPTEPHNQGPEHGLKLIFDHTPIRGQVQLPGITEPLKILSANVGANIVLAKDIQAYAAMMGIDKHTVKFNTLLHNMVTAHSKMVFDFLESQTQSFGPHLICTQENTFSATKTTGLKTLTFRISSKDYGTAIYGCYRKNPAPRLDIPCYAEPVIINYTKSKTQRFTVVDLKAYKPKGSTAETPTLCRLINAHLGWSKDRNNPEDITKDLGDTGKNIGLIAAIKEATSNGIPVVLVGDSNLDPKDQEAGITKFKELTGLTEIFSVDGKTSANITGGLETVDHIWCTPNAKTFIKNVKIVPGSNPFALGCWIFDELRKAYPEKNIPYFDKLTPEQKKYIADNNRFKRKPHASGIMPGIK